MIAAGAVIGLVLSALLGRLTLGAAVSVAGPAWRAARIDPAVALRDE